VFDPFGPPQATGHDLNFIQEHSMKLIFLLIFNVIASIYKVNDSAHSFLYEFYCFWVTRPEANTSAAVDLFVKQLHLLFFLIIDQGDCCFSLEVLKDWRVKGKIKKDKGFAAVRANLMNQRKQSFVLMLCIFFWKINDYL